MGEAARKLELSYADYLTLERETDLRHEFLGGEAWAMAGGTLRHSKVMTNLTVAFGAALRGRRCQPYNSESKIHIVDTGLFTYPDLSVICGQPHRSPEDRNAATNPTLLAEVLSASTEGWDRGGKFAHYRQIPTLRYYLLVSVDEVRVELFTREADGRWMLSEHLAGGVVPLPELDVTLAVDELYLDLPEEPEASSPQQAQSQ